MKLSTWGSGGSEFRLDQARANLSSIRLPLKHPRLVVIEPAWKKVNYLDDLIFDPPSGYRFEYSGDFDRAGKFVGYLSRSSLPYLVQQKLGEVIPLQFLVSYLRSKGETSEMKYCLTHFRSRGPYLLDMLTEMPSILSSSQQQLHKRKAFVRKQLLSHDCKKVICWVDAGRRALIQELGDDIAEKAVVMPWGTKVREPRESNPGDALTLLFVNSSNLNDPNAFYSKGGHFVVDAFVNLKRRYKKLRLIMRSAVPRGLRQAYSSIPDLTLINNPISRTGMHYLWQSADIFVLPNSINTPAKSFLEAMSYGIPVVSTNLWANSEIVADGKTGILVPHHDASRFLKGDVFQETSGYFRMVFSENPLLVQSLTGALDTLIQDAGLRKVMGRTARALVETGKFSIEARNARLKVILDSAFC